MNYGNLLRDLKLSPVSILLLVISLFSTGGANGAIMTDKAKAASLALFEQKKSSLVIVVEKIQRRTVDNSSVEYEQRRVVGEYKFDEYQSLLKHIDEDKYVIFLRYANESNFPTLYGGSDSFEGTDSRALFQIRSSVVLEHYLGKDYLQFDPELRAITGYVSIQVKISETSELKKLLENPMIISVSHIGDHSIEFMQLVQ